MLDIATADYETLKAAQAQINARLAELEAAAIVEIKEKASLFGLTLIRQQPQEKQRRRRRTKAEIEMARANV